MNRSIIIYMLGWIMNMEAIFMTLPVVTAVVYRESIGFIWALRLSAVCWDLCAPGRSHAQRCFLPGKDL